MRHHNLHYFSPVKEVKDECAKVTLRVRAWDMDYAEGCSLTETHLVLYMDFPFPASTANMADGEYAFIHFCQRVLPEYRSKRL